MTAFAIAWAAIYFIVGVFKSFTLTHIDFWSGVVFFLATFLLPLPVVSLAIWFPKTAGQVLLSLIPVAFAALLSTGVSALPLLFKS